MSHQAVTWAYEQDVTPAGTKFVLVTLANYATGDGYCYPGQDRLATDTGMNARHVRRCLAQLEDARLIYRRHRYDRHGKRTSDEFWLVGFKPLPDDIAGSLPDTMSSSLPDNTAGSDDLLPDISDTTTGHLRHDYRTICPVPIRNLNRQSEPSEEPLVKTSGADVLTTFMALYEILTGNPYVRARTTVPPALAKKIGRVETALAEFGVNGADGDEVLARWPRLRQKYPKATIHALPEHWHSLRDDEWAAYLEDIRHDDKPSKDPIANARALIERNRKLAGAGGDAGGIHDRPARDDRFRDREVGRDVPGLSDGRT